MSKNQKEELKTRVHATRLLDNHSCKRDYLRSTDEPISVALLKQRNLNADDIKEGK